MACKDWHDIPAGPASWRRVQTTEEGKCPHPFVAFLSAACYHCAQPACLSSCPVNAISKREQDGIVTVDREIYLGKEQCQFCLEVCPYSAPQFGAEPYAKMHKCDLCLERWSEGKKPICITSCPTRALDAGPADEIKSKYGDITIATGFDFNDKIKPSVVFKPKLRPGQTNRALR